MKINQIRPLSVNPKQESTKIFKSSNVKTLHVLNENLSQPKMVTVNQFSRTNQVDLNQSATLIQTHNNFAQSPNQQGSFHTQQNNQNQIHQYLVQKFGNSLKDGQNFDFEQMFAQISEVFCIVCEQYVPQNKIDQHCKVCQAKPQSEVDQVGKVQEKLEKCNLLIQKIKKTLKLYCTDKQQVIQYLQLLWKCVSQIINTYTSTEIEQLAKDLDLFLQFFNKLEFEDEQIEKIITQILTVIIKIKDFTERKTQLSNQENVQEFLRQSLADKNQPFITVTDVQHTRNPLNNVSNANQNFKESQQFQPISHREQSFNNRMQDSFQQKQEFKNSGAFGNRIVIDEDEGSLNSSVQMTQNEILYKYNGKKNNENQRNRQSQQIVLNQIKSPNNSNDQKSKFFLIAANLKEQYPPNHIVRTILVVSLYETANKQGIKVEDYEKFIKQQYQNYKQPVF